MCHERKCARYVKPDSTWSLCESSNLNHSSLNPVIQSAMSQPQRSVSSHPGGHVSTTALCIQLSSQTCLNHCVLYPVIQSAMSQPQLSVSSYPVSHVSTTALSIQSSSRPCLNHSALYIVIHSARQPCLNHSALYPVIQSAMSQPQCSVSSHPVGHVSTTALCI